MPKALLHIRIAGEGVSPETVKAGDLAELLKETEKAIQETAVAHGAGLPDEALVSLVRIDPGSAELDFAIAPNVVGGTSEVSNAIATGEYKSLPASAWQSLSAISKQAVKRKWKVELLPNLEMGVKPAVISAEHEVPDPPPPPTATGTTTIYGRCLQVGGIKPRADILLEDGTTRLHIVLDHGMAKRLANRLYEEVGIEGEAVWETGAWKIKAFTATRILDYQPTSVTEAFEGLARLAQGRWDNVDPDAYVRQLRGED